MDADKAQSAIARAFQLTTRYIDDLASINNPYLHSLLYVDQHCTIATLQTFIPELSWALLLIQVSPSTTWMSQFSVSAAAGAESPQSYMTNESTPHWQISSSSNFHIHYPTSQQQPNMGLSPVNTTDFAESSCCEMTSPAGWLGLYTTCSQRAMIPAACSNK